MSQEPTSQEQPDVILTNSNTPFSSKNGAALQLSQRGLKGIYEVREWADGFALVKISSAAGVESTPPPTETEQGARHTPPPRANHKKEGPTHIQNEKFHRVRFHVKSAPDQQENVELSVNGDCLLIKRDMEVIIPDRYKECADHALIAQYTQKPGERRQLVGYVKVFPYDILGESTYAEYEAQKRAGNAATRKMYGAPTA